MDTAQGTVTPAEVAQQTPPVLEATAKEVDAEIKKEDPLSSKYAALAKREKALQQREAEIKSIKKRLAEEAAQWGPFKEKKDKAKDDPYGWLEMAGLTPDDIINRAIEAHTKGEKPKSVSPMEKEVQELREWKRQMEEEKATQAKTAKLNEFKEQIKQRVEEKADDYELIKAFNHIETVYNVIENHYGETGNILEIDEACDLVEDHLVKQAEEEAKILSKAKKLKGKLTFAEALEEKSTTPEVKRETQTKTLTNQVSQESAPTKKAPMTDEERLEEAAKLLRFSQS